MVRSTSNLSSLFNKIMCAMHWKMAVPDGDKLSALVFDNWVDSADFGRDKCKFSSDTICVGNRSLGEPHLTWCISCNVAHNLALIGAILSFVARRNDVHRLLAS